MTAKRSLKNSQGLRKHRPNAKKLKGNNMTVYLWGLLWSIEWRWGFGLDVESVDSRPVWAVVNGEVKAYPFDGLVINLPLLTISIGNVWKESEDDDDSVS